MYRKEVLLEKSFKFRLYSSFQWNFFLFTSSDHLFNYSCSKHWINIFKQVTRCENQAGSWRPWTDGTVRQYRPTQIFICCEDCQELEQVARESENSWDWGVLQEKAQRETRVIIWFWRYSQWKELSLKSWTIFML